jgi:hypothetical protein
MKISHLISGLLIPLSNQEKLFTEKYNSVKIDHLNEQDKWLAQNLVRKGIYTISKDNNTLIKNLDETTYRSL